MKKLILLFALRVLAGVPVGYAVNSEIETQNFHFVLLRGLTRESGHWGSEFEDQLRHQFGEIKVTYMDLPGSGIFNREKAPPRVEDIMIFMKSHYDHELHDTGYDRVLVATSLGSMVAAEWVQSYPEDFKFLCLVAPSFKGLCTFSERVGAGVRGDMIQVAFTHDIQKKESIILGINSNDSANFECNLRDWVKIQDLRPMSTANIIRQSLAGMRYEFSGVFPSMPILILASEGDRLLSTTCVQKVQQRLGADLFLHETAGHGLPIDAPEWMVEHLKLWLKTGDQKLLQ